MGCPEPAVRRQPEVELGQGLRTYAVETPLGIGSDLQHSRLLQDAEVLRDRRLAQMELLDQIPDRPLPVAEQVEDGMSAGVGEDLERRQRRHLPSMLV